MHQGITPCEGTNHIKLMDYSNLLWEHAQVGLTKDFKLEFYGQYPLLNNQPMQLKIYMNQIGVELEEKEGCVRATKIMEGRSYRENLEGDK